MSTRTAVVPLTAGQIATRDLILLALDRLENRTLREEGGFISVPLMELCGIEDTASRRETVNMILRKLHEDGTVVIDTKGRTHRIYGVEMKKPLRNARRRQIEIKRLDLQKASMPEAEELTEIEALKADCAKAYAAILAFTADQRAEVGPGGYVKMSAAAVLRSVDIGRERGREIRHYLRLLKLAVSIKECGGNSILWWWDVREAELDLNAIENLATSREFCYANAGRSRKGRGTRKAPPESKSGPVVVVRAAGVAAPEEPKKEVVVPAAVPKPAPKPGPPLGAAKQAAPAPDPVPAAIEIKVPDKATSAASDAEQTGDATNANRALAAIIARLEAENLALKNAKSGLESENSALREDMSSLEKRLHELEVIEKAHAACEEIDNDIRAILARHSTGG